MLSDPVRQQAAAAIQSRFKLRNEVLAKELDQLAATSIDPFNADEVSRMGIRLRLICEHDLFERAFIVWNNLKKAHSDCGGVRNGTLMKDFIIEARVHMQEASLNLANYLKQHSEGLAPAFKGKSAIDATWLSKLRNRALEKYTKDMEEYIQGLGWGLRSVIGNMRNS